MTRNAKRAAAIGGSVLVLAGGIFYVLTNRDVIADVPVLNELAPDPECPLTSRDPATESRVERPAVAVKIENNPVAYPLSGLEDAEIVYEEPVEGGLTRFMAIYHCTDSAQAGPVRSARIVDPPIMSPYTRILGAAGGNDVVLDALRDAEVVLIDETGAGDAMTRVDRPGITSEHTLYADTASIRKLGRRQFEDPPPDDLFEFGDLPGVGRRARSVTLTFSAGAVVTYEWTGERWARSDGEAPLVNESGEQIEVDNVIIEEHTVNHSAELGDVLGTPSPEIEDVTGSGRAFLFRDGRVFAGKWTRESVDEPVRFETSKGDAFVLHAGTTWIELLPDKQGDVKGSFSISK
ncbi:MAG TPA: DUF3048 domain-containing protein [Actinomycetota bacterium]|nr:DUF3048 domain-containing protein [Actinomycetota bacterium]